MDDHRLAAALATTAGEHLLRLRALDIAADELKARGDREAHELLVQALVDNRPDDGVLSEEGDHDTDRVLCRRAWIVDPLDGTREFSEPDRTDWAVHVALAVDGTPVVGAVALPALGITLHTAGPPPFPSRAPGAPRLVVSRTRPPEHAQLLADRLGAVLIPMGSAGAKAMAVVRGDADVYAHAGGQYEWDSAAPVAVAAAAGLHVSRLDGSPLVYNQADPWLPDLLICRPELAQSVIAVCAEREPSHSEQRLPDRA
ncbi:MAG: 3'(2'),5'-bisphosphate nucleotidase CysQ [Acidobacteria bacterium]|nr:3'(2'),5'-bisphosphate nucleotidase CysQ [Acidobacteriota bacterium]